MPHRAACRRCALESRPLEARLHVPRHPLWKTWALLAATLALAACAALLGPRTVNVSQAQLQQWIDRQFPLDSRALELFDVTVTAPRLTLRPEADRIAAECDIDVKDRLLRVPQRGTIALSYGVRFEPADNTVRLTDVKLERVAIDGAPSLLQRQLDRFGAQLAALALRDLAFYTLRPKDVEAARGRGYRFSELHVTGTGLAITLLPIEGG